MSEPLSADWIRRLWGLWSSIRDSRRDELQRITNLFGNPELLAKTYVEPDCQRTNPADHHEDEPQRTFRQPIRRWLNAFLSGEFFERDGRNTLFVLSDAGMGKSSLLMMLKLTHMLSFWPSELNFRLEKLGEDTLSTLEEIERPSKTILLLDALDEDSTAWGRIEERLFELLHGTKGFRQVILTCRTQFFPEGGQKPIETPEKVEVAGFVCNMLYLSPFGDQQVEDYLKKRYPNSFWAQLQKPLTKRDNPRIERARALLDPMKSLRMRPMLLSHIEMLLEAPLATLTEYSVYSALVDCWLLREERKNPNGPTREQLHRACETVAMHLQQSGKRLISSIELGELMESDPDAATVQRIDVGGRSLLNRTSDGSYRFAHYSIQEFLVARHLINASSRSEIHATHQLLRFLFSWASEDSHNRMSRLPLNRLDLGHVREFGSVGLEGQDLRGAQMPKRLPGIDLSGSDLRQANLSKAKLRGADLRGADLRGADLSKADLRGVDLRGANLVGANLHRCKLTGSRRDPIWVRDVQLVWVPGGEYRLGPDLARRVRVSPFWIGKFPVTRAQFSLFIESGPERALHEIGRNVDDPEQPVVGVSWLEAMAFCEWARLSLPTRAQWEAAARGQEGRTYPWGNEPPTRRHANYGRANEGPTPVSFYRSGEGPYGTLDQAGNVWEWCLDEDHPKPAPPSGVPDRDPKSYNSARRYDPSIDRILCGGGWKGASRFLASAIARSRRADTRLPDIGFRVVLPCEDDPFSSALVGPRGVRPSRGRA